ncbi:hypothetical protein IHI25_00385 [Candidatus Parvarchaeota archaeon]|nr:hypothetical protein [Candidatus Acidifodinimicrobium mancum]
MAKNTSRLVLEKIVGIASTIIGLLSSAQKMFIQKKEVSICFLQKL